MENKLGFCDMGKAKKGPKFANMKMIINSKTIKKYKKEVLNPNKKDLEKEKLPRNVPAISSALFLSITLHWAHHIG